MDGEIEPRSWSHWVRTNTRMARQHAQQLRSPWLFAVTGAFAAPALLRWVEPALFDAAHEHGIVDFAWAVARIGCATISAVIVIALLRWTHTPPCSIGLTSESIGLQSAIGVAATITVFLALAIFVACVVTIRWLTSISALAETNRQYIADAFTNDPVIPTVLVVVASSVIEELWYRGALLSALLHVLKHAGCAVLLTSVLFALAHYDGGLAYVLKAGLGGIVLGGLRLWTNSVIAALSCHVSFNMAQFALVAILLSQEDT